MPISPATNRTSRREDFQPPPSATIGSAWQDAFSAAQSGPPAPASGPATNAASVNNKTNDDQQQRLRIAGQLVHPGGTATQKDADAVATHLAASMSLAQLTKIQGSGLHITVAHGAITDYLTTLKGVRPRGYPPGATWDNVPGTVDPNNLHNIIVATHAGPHGERLVPGADQSSSADVTLHETGHAVNRLQGGGKLASDGPEFTKAYNQDTGHGPLADGYYHQADAPAGRDEAYAESHAEFLTNPTKMETEYPHLYTYWQHYYGDPK